MCLVGDIGCRLSCPIIALCGASVWSKRARGLLSFFRYMVACGYNADVNSQRCGSGFARVRGRCLSAVGCVFPQGGGRKEGGPFFSAVPPLGFGIPPCSGELSPLSCGAVLLERGCVSLCVRVSSAMRFHRVGFEDCVFR